MRKNFNEIILLLLSLMFFNCSSYNTTVFKGKGSVEQARLNVINDFVSTVDYQTSQYYLNKREGKAFDVYWIINRDIKEKNIYAFAIFPEHNGYISLSIEDSLGKVPKSNFPNNYIVKEQTLFIWKDSVTPLKQDVLDIMNNYHVLDSVDIKIDLNILPKDYEDERMIVMDDDLKSVHYYICKSNLEKYKKVITNKALGYYKLPRIKCSDDVDL